MELYGHSIGCCKCMGGCHADPLDGIVKMRPEITYTTNRTYPNGKKAPDGIEIRFGSVRPSPEFRMTLKAHGFKFSEKQTMWYALDKPKPRELAAFMESNEVDADDTQYEKRYLWAKVGHRDFFDKLTNYTEFMIRSGEARQFYRSKAKLLAAYPDPSGVIYNGSLSFKKFYNKVVGEEGENEEDMPDGEESEDVDHEEEADDQEEESEDDSNADWKPAPKPATGNSELADRLESLADSMQKQIDAKINSATSKQRPTPKRLRVAAQMRQEGYALRNIQNVLYGLAQAHRTGEISNYPLLARIKTRAQVELLNRYNDAFNRPHEDKYLQSTFDYRRSEFKSLGISSFRDWTEAIHQRDQLTNGTPGQSRPGYDLQAEKISELEMKIKGMKIPGFFPTPPSLIEQLIAYAGISFSDEVLEPSAGKGDILDAVKNSFGDVAALHACEVNPTLREMLALKGYHLVGTDFLQLTRKYDVILMNPPFENKQDIDHVTHAISLLKPGGRLAAIMGEGAFFRTQQKDQEFRDLLSDRNAFVSEPIKGAFKNAFNQTGITVRLVAINEDGSYPEISEFEQSQDDGQEPDNNDDMDEIELLELEALAELELLKLKIDIEQKRKGLNGLSGIDRKKANHLKRLANKIDLPALWDFK